MTCALSVFTARNHIRNYLQGETVLPKKYFYALRPILACRWALEQKSPPPVLFSRLVEAELPGSLGPAVEHLLLNQFLLAELQF